MVQKQANAEEIAKDGLCHECWRSMSKWALLCLRKVAVQNSDEEKQMDGVLDHTKRSKSRL